MYFRKKITSSHYVSPEIRKNEDHIELVKTKKDEEAAVALIKSKSDDCTHPDSMVEENSGFCMGCGVYTGAFISPLAVAGSIPGLYHHTFSSAIIPSESRKKRAADAKGGVADMTIQRWIQDQDGCSEDRSAISLPTSKVTPYKKKFENDDTDTNQDYSYVDISYSLPLTHPLYYGSYPSIRQATIFPPPVRSVVGNISMTTKKRAAMYSVAFRSVTRDLIGGQILTVNDSLSIPEGIFSTGSYKYCSSSPCLTFAADVSKDKQIEICKQISQDILNEVDNVFIENSAYLIKQRRRIHISLFVAIMVAHLRKVHGFFDGVRSKIITDNPDICKTCDPSECLNILQRTGITESTSFTDVKAAPRGRPKTGSSLKRSFIFALASRAGIPQNCMSRLQRVIFQLATHQTPTDGKEDEEEDTAVKTDKNNEEE